MDEPKVMRATPAGDELVTVRIVRPCNVAGLGAISAEQLGPDGTQGPVVELPAREARVLLHARKPMAIPHGKQTRAKGKGAAARAAAGGAEA